MCENIIAKYAEAWALYDECQCYTVELIQRLLAHAGLDVHSVTGRTKTQESLAGKVKRPGKSYKRLAEITDLAGIRVTVYFPEDVDRVAVLLRQEFAVNEQLSVDKRAEKPTDSFGYQSLHLISAISEVRTGLPEYARFKDLQIEIQVRTVLQHAWAEIEHDLGYKAVADVPRPIRRRFAKLSALLELADDEFQRIRDELAEYANEVVTSIQKNPDEAGIDGVSLSEFVSQNAVVADIAKKIESTYNIKLIGYRDEQWLWGLPRAFTLLGIENIGDVLNLLRKHGEHIFKAWDLVFDPAYNGTYDGSIDMIPFALVLVATVLESPKGAASKLFEEVKIVPQSDFEKLVRARVAN